MVDQDDMTDAAPQGNEARNLFARIPGLAYALRKRMADYPEYRAWLEGLGGRVLAAVEESPPLL